MSHYAQQATAKRETAEIVLINAALVLALVCFLVGIWAPMLTVTRLIWLSNSFSVLSAIQQLAVEQEWFLCIVIALFSVIVPSGKLAILFLTWNQANTALGRRLLHWVHLSGKWSMLDVFVVAVLVASAKLGVLASLELHYGIYVFTAAVLLIMLITHWIVKRLQ